MSIKIDDVIYYSQYEIQEQQELHKQLVVRLDMSKNSYKKHIAELETKLEKVENLVEILDRAPKELRALLEVLGYAAKQSQDD